MIKTVIRNLLSNAIKFSNEETEILVTVQEQEGMAVVSVRTVVVVSTKRTRKIVAYRYSFQYFRNK